MHSILSTIFVLLSMLAITFGTFPDGWKTTAIAVCTGLAAIALAILGLTEAIQKAMRK